MVQIKTLRISERLHKFLTNNAVRKGESYEEIIWRMLGTKTLTKEQSNEIKSAYEKLV